MKVMGIHMLKIFMSNLQSLLGAAQHVDMPNYRDPKMPWQLDIMLRSLGTAAVQTYLKVNFITLNGA